MPAKTLIETLYLRLMENEGWFYVERPNASSVVTLIPITRDGKLLLVEQFRRPLSRNVLEFPAGLVGDEPGLGNESFLTAAGRELEEETGYRAGKLECIASTATSPGMANELVHFVLAWELEKVGLGGGTEHEDIRVHEVPLTEMADFLVRKEKAGLLVAAKLYAGLYFAKERWG